MLKIFKRIKILLTLQIQTMNQMKKKLLNLMMILNNNKSNKIMLNLIMIIKFQMKSLIMILEVFKNNKLNLK